MEQRAKAMPGSRHTDSCGAERAHEVSLAMAAAMAQDGRLGLFAARLALSRPVPLVALARDSATSSSAFRRPSMKAGMRVRTPASKGSTSPRREKASSRWHSRSEPGYPSLRRDPHWRSNASQGLLTCWRLRRPHIPTTAATAPLSMAALSTCSASVCVEKIVINRISRRSRSKQPSIRADCRDLAVPHQPLLQLTSRDNCPGPHIVRSTSL